MQIRRGIGGVGCALACLLFDLFSHSAVAENCYFHSLFNPVNKKNYKAGNYDYFCGCDLPPKDVPHFKLELFHFLFLNANTPLALEDGNPMNYVAWTCCIPNAIFQPALLLLLRYKKVRH